MAPGRAHPAFFEATRRMVEGKRVRLEYDQNTKDRYGRTLAYVYLEDGAFLNMEIIRQGYSFAYTRFPFKYIEEFRRHERVLSPALHCERVHSAGPSSAIASGRRWESFSTVKRPEYLLVTSGAVARYSTMVCTS